MQVLDLTSGSLIQGPKEKNVWINIHPDELSQLKGFGIFDEDFQKIRKQRIAFYLEFEKYTGMILFDLDYYEGNIKKFPLIMFFDKGRIITISDLDHIGNFYSDFIVQKQMKKIAIEQIVFELLADVINKNSEVGLKLEKDIAKLEEKINTTKTLDVKGTISLRKALLRISRHYWGQRQILFDFRENRINMLSPGKEIESRLSDLYNSMFFDINMNEQLHAIIADVRELYMSTVSNKINDSIKKLTVITVLLTIIATISAVPNTIATVFGVPYLPLKADVPINLPGFSLLPWQLIVLLLVLSTVIPTWLLYSWWKKSYGDWE
ncbi:hypothetical protein HY988_02720 [Candidatus Micrarchaeota archaeon]|nr:hypothetical protein [Candidatus Micrarchaeota archaeon]